MAESPWHPSHVVSAIAIMGATADMEKRTQTEKAFRAGMSFAFCLCSFLIYFAYKMPGFILTGHF